MAQIELPSQHLLSECEGREHLIRNAVETLGLLSWRNAYATACFKWTLTMIMTLPEGAECVARLWERHRAEGTPLEDAPSIDFLRHTAAVVVHVAKALRLDVSPEASVAELASEASLASSGDRALAQGAEAIEKDQPSGGALVARGAGPRNRARPQLHTKAASPGLRPEFQAEAATTPKAPSQPRVSPPASLDAQLHTREAIFVITMEGRADFELCHSTLAEEEAATRAEPCVRQLILDHYFSEAPNEHLLGDSLRKEGVAVKHHVSGTAHEAHSLHCELRLLADDLGFGACSRGDTFYDGRLLKTTVRWMDLLVRHRSSDPEEQVAVAKSKQQEVAPRQVVGGCAPDEGVMKEASKYHYLNELRDGLTRDHRRELNSNQMTVKLDRLRRHFEAFLGKLATIEHLSSQRRYTGQLATASPTPPPPSPRHPGDREARGV